MSAWRKRLATAGLSVALVAGGIWVLNRLDEAPLPHAERVTTTASLDIARGRYLARAGNCLACHTRQGGVAFAGGRGIETPFGVIYAPNLTPDRETGIGAWSASEFWRALHNGRSRDGRLLSPAFPYPSYTRVTREDSDAIFAFLQSLPPVVQPGVPSRVRFPFNTQAALAVWRALYFRPGVFEPVPSRSAEWNRGAYLVQGLGHCAACHSPRNAMGAVSTDGRLSGGMAAGWYAPALNTSNEGGVAEWPRQDVVMLMGAGRSPRAAVSGPMAEVVYHSLQYLSDADLQAMADYLQALPPTDKVAAPRRPPSPASMQRGRATYERQCVQCHGGEGQGDPEAFPPLAGNRAVMLENPVNLVHMVLRGGYLPATGGNPQPHGMPPFLQRLSDAEVADVLSYIRNAWGNAASRVDTIDVHRAREGRDS